MMKQLTSFQRRPLRTSLIAAGLALAITTPAFAQGLNPFGNYSNSPHIYAPNGTYLGNLNGNPMDPNSIANPMGPHGSAMMPNSINNPFTYGSPYGYAPPASPFGSQGGIRLCPTC
jgi:hypothetical protein